MHSLRIKFKIYYQNLINFYRNKLYIYKIFIKYKDYFKENLNIIKIS